ncbi:translin-associated factor X-interacting protein 1 [Astyanax mexicanus]|uniref:translin-associated factor X-interacting protein 1 n=1 Tax=Astyanax mexicanus TaxID=7994 RepID=UPI0020CB4499|nr:translin-associated factor X-interacting protein 1 [Astyanax mexicanus]
MSIKEDGHLPPLPAPERTFPGKGVQWQVKPVSVLVRSKDADKPGYLSTWPAHASSQTVQQKYPLSGLNRHHGCSDEFGGRATKPRFLEQLQSYLKRELTALDTLSPKLQERKLQVYQEVFDSLIEEFTTYKPLLSTIKNEYDITLAYLQEQIRELKPLRSQLVLLSEQCDKKVLELRKNERAEIRALKQERQHFQQVIEGMREQQRALETQVYHLQEELAAQYLQYRDECDARKLLIAKISSMSYNTEEEPDGDYNEVQSEDPVTVKLALKVCREDLTRAQVELNRLHAEYGEVVPHRDWENLDHMYKENLLQLETLQSDFNQMKSEYDILLDEHRKVSLQKDNLQRELDVFQEASTPRPHWEQCADVLGGRERWSEIFEGQSSKKRLEVLLEELNSMGMEQKDFFPGMGTSSNVPIYLRYEGQLKNLRLNKADVVRIIKDIWREKAFEDEKRENSSDLKEFLHQYMQRQYGGQAGEWIYSLMHCINCNLKDDFISLFYDILTDKVHESLYHSQTQMLSHLLKVFVQSDSTESGLFTASEFSEALRKAFPLKGDQDLEELIAAAQSELETSEGSIAYQRLYTEDTDGKHGHFLGIVKRQATTERHQYINQLRTQLEGKEEVSVEDLTSAFKKIDPTLDSESLKRYLQIAFHTKDPHLHPELLSTEVPIQRLSVANVCRAGLMPHPE